MQTSPTTERDRQIFELAKQGVTRKEISLALGIAERTVAQHIRKVAARLGLSGNRQKTISILNVLDPVYVDQSRLARLTDRQRFIALRVIEGKANREIGDEIGVSTQTVKNHLRDVFDRTGASTRVELRDLVTISLAPGADRAQAATQ
jgi:DNA-binding CsgD family transcriptional regulator